MYQASASKPNVRIEDLLISRDASATDAASAGFGPNSLSTSESFFFCGMCFKIISDPHQPPSPDQHPPCETHDPDRHVDRPEAEDEILPGKEDENHPGAAEDEA